MTWAVVCASSPQGQRTDFSMPIFFMWQTNVRGGIVSEGVLLRRFTVYLLLFRLQWLCFFLSKSLQALQIIGY